LYHIQEVASVGMEKVKLEIENVINWKIWFI
jgi:hypothetical protein